MNCIEFFVSGKAILLPIALGIIIVTVYVLMIAALILHARRDK